MNTSPTIRVFVVDDHPVVREGLKVLLAGAPDVSVVGASGTAHDAVQQLPDTGADVVLLDLDLGAEQGLAALPALARAAPSAKFLIVTALRDARCHRDALEAGAHGLVEKREGADFLLKAIRRVHAGELWFDRRLLESALHDALETAQRLDPDRARIASLTPREREIASLVARGLDNDEIARRLSLSEKTVRNRIVEVCSKLGVAGRLDLLVYANQHGLGRIGGDEPPR